MQLSCLVKTYSYLFHWSLASGYQFNLSMMFTKFCQNNFTQWGTIYWYPSNLYNSFFLRTNHKIYIFELKSFFFLWKFIKIDLYSWKIKINSQFIAGNLPQIIKPFSKQLVSYLNWSRARISNCKFSNTSLSQFDIFKRYYRLFCKWY